MSEHQIKEVACDMDGFLVQLYEAVLELYGVRQEHVRDMANGMTIDEVIREHALEHHNPGTRLRAAEATDQKVWKTVCSQPTQWWKRLRPDPSGMLLLARLAARGVDVFVVSQPLVLGRYDVGYGISVHGKRLWLEQHLPALVDSVVFTRDKRRLATPTTLLIDDSPIHVSEWRARGGPAVLWHQPWNTTSDEHRDDAITRTMHLEGGREMPEMPELEPRATP